MNRKEAIAKIREIHKLQKTDKDAEKYLDRLIELHHPEFDELKTPTGQIGGNKAAHLASAVTTYYKNDAGLW